MHRDQLEGQAKDGQKDRFNPFVGTRSETATASASGTAAASRAVMTWRPASPDAATARPTRVPWLMLFPEQSPGCGR